MARVPAQVSALLEEIAGRLPFILGCNLVGVYLYGPPPETFVPPITPETLFAALEREVGYLREELIEKLESEWRDVPYYRAYAVLTLCRILYSHCKGAVVSKKRAAAWALKNLPEEWHELIRHALTPASEGRSALSLPRIRRFIAFADAQFHVGKSSI